METPILKPEVAYEWTYGAVYSPKWIKGLTLSADFWHIDLRSIASFVGPQFIIDFENSFPGLVIRNPTTGAITEVIDPNLKPYSCCRGRYRLRSDLYSGYFDLWSWRLWQIDLHP